jgi:hypothetical protein
LKSQVAIGVKSIIGIADNANKSGNEPPIIQLAKTARNSSAPPDLLALTSQKKREATLLNASAASIHPASRTL